ncbi:acyltransferase [Saccharothrix sp. AJ9571]|nr:acyltransferase [Saccharothrix sp. AJ9571]
MTQTAARPARPAAPARGSHYMHGLDVLRVLCSVAVLYNHVAGWAKMRGSDEFWVADLIEGGVVASLHLNDLLGFVGVGSFLVISGVVVTHVSTRETSGQFLARRAVRLFPALWVAILLAWVLALTGALGVNQPPDFGDLLLNLGLLNYSFEDASTLLAVTWTLTVQVVFYLLAAATIPLLRRWPWLPPAIAAALVSVLISVTNDPSTAGPAHLRIIASFLPVLFLGQLVMLVRGKRLAPVPAIALGLVHLWLATRAAATWSGTPDGPAYVRTLVLILLLLLLCTRANGRIARSRVIKVLADRTYAVYLLHFAVVLSALNLLAGPLGFWPALGIGLAVLAVTTELLHRFVERPLARAFRRWEARRAGAEPELTRSGDR